MLSVFTGKGPLLFRTMPPRLLKATVPDCPTPLLSVQRYAGGPA